MIGVEELERVFRNNDFIIKKMKDLEGNVTIDKAIRILKRNLKKRYNIKKVKNEYIIDLIENGVIKPSGFKDGVMLISAKEIENKIEEVKEFLSKKYGVI